MSTRTSNRTSRAARRVAGSCSRCPTAARRRKTTKATKPADDDDQARGRRARGQAAADPAPGAPRERGAGHRRAARGDRPHRELPARQPPLEGAGRGALQAGRALLGRVEGGLPREDGAPIRPRSPPATTTAPRAPGCRAARRPSIWRRRRRSTCASSTSTRSSARSTRSSTSTRSRCATRAKTGEAIKYFQIILDKYPRSRYIADAWMAIAEYRFYEQQNYKSSLEAYEKVLQHPKSQLYDLALFKTAWCYWKLGDTNKAAMRFKDVLDLAKKKAGRTEAEQKRAAELQGQALDYLVELFTEDDTKSAHDAFEFLAQIGGKQYSRKVLKQLADTVFDQTRYERAVEAYRLLIELDPNAGDAPDYHGKIVECYQLLGDTKTAVAEMRKLAANYGARSAWATANKDRPKTVAARAHAGRGAHPQRSPRRCTREAQQNEKTTKVVDKDRYARAAEAYEFYLANFPDAADAVELRYLRADILYFKLGQVRRRRARVPGGRQDPAGRQVPQGRAAAGDGRVREGAQAARGYRQARDHRQRSPVRRGRRPLRDALPQGQGDRHRHLQERPVLLRLRRLRRGGQALRPDRRALPRRSQRGRGRRQDPAGAQQGQGLREHRELGAAAQEDQGLLVEGRAGAPRQAGRRRGDEVGREVRRRRQVRQGGRLLPARAPRSTRATATPRRRSTTRARCWRRPRSPRRRSRPTRSWPTSTRAPARRRRRCSPRRASRRTSPTTTAPPCSTSSWPRSTRRTRTRRTRCAARACCARASASTTRRSSTTASTRSRYKDKSDAKDVAFQAAVVREDQKDWRGAAASFGAYVKTYPGDARSRRGARARGRRAPQGRQRRRGQGVGGQGAVGVGGGKHGKGSDEREDASY